MGLSVICISQQEVRSIEPSQGFSRDKQGALMIAEARLSITHKTFTCFNDCLFDVLPVVFIFTLRIKYVMLAIVIA